MKTIAKALAITGLILLVWGAWLAVETAQTLTQVAATVADLRVTQEANRQAIKYQRVHQDQLRQEMERIKDADSWKIKHYTCIDDGKTPENPTYCKTKDGTDLTREHLTPENRIVAVKPGRLPLGTWLEIHGVGWARVADWGNLQDDELDLWVGENNQDTAIRLGVQTRKVTMMK